MSNARDFSLLEKWADAAANATVPPISPTSPKATKFCCCPNRRRYTLKQPKKSTLHARNIFIDNDFHYIDDAAHDTYHSLSLSHSLDSDHDRTPAGSAAQPLQPAVAGDKNDNDYDDYDDVASDVANDNRRNLAAQQYFSHDDDAAQWRHDKSCHNSSSNAKQLETRTTKALAPEQEPKELRNDVAQIQRKSVTSTTKTKETHSNCAASTEDANESAAGSGSAAAAIQPQPPHNDAAEKDEAETETEDVLDGSSNPRSDQQQQQIQRLSNSNHSCNKENYFNSSDCNCRRTESSAATSHHSDGNATRRRCNNCAVHEAQTATSNGNGSSAVQIDFENKMTITTTNGASRKRSDCGLTTNTSATTPSTPTTPTSPTSPSSPAGTTLARPTTPSLTTVIKTTMVKRSPSNDAATPATMRPIAAKPANHKVDKTSASSADKKGDESNEPTRTVKERIAAIVCGNEQAKHQHDINAAKPKTQCNRNPSNMTTVESQVKSAINSLQPHAPVAAPHSPTVAPSSTALVAATAADDIPRCRRISAGLSDAAHRAPPVDGGCATMPRRRSPGLAAFDAAKYGSKSAAAGAAMTADKKFLAGSVAAARLGDKDASPQLAALDNLDLALSLDLTDEDGDDPYIALQDYLERVKNEINEVFELHKARQRMQPLPPGEEHPGGLIVEAAATTTTGDELARSIESDSGFDSASGGHIGNNGSSAKHAPTRVVVAGVTTMPAPPTEISCQSSLADGRRQLAASEHVTSPKTTQLKALPPPPLSPTKLAPNRSDSDAAPGKCLQVADATASDDVNIWANKFLRDLDNLMASDRNASATSSSAASSPTSKSSPLLLSAAASAAIQSRYGRSAPADRETASSMTAAAALVLRPEKHATIPLQSFNLDCGRIDNSCNGGGATKPHAVAYMRTLSAPTPYHQQQQQQQQHQQHSLNDNKSACMAGGRGNRNSLATFTAASMEHHHQQLQHHHNLTNFHCNDAAITTATAVATAGAAATETAPTTTTTATILKIEESSGCKLAAAGGAESVSVVEEKEPLAANRRQRQLENDMETIRTALLSQSQQLAAMEDCDRQTLVASVTATSIPKRERINHATVTANAKSKIATSSSSSSASSPPTSAQLTPSKVVVAATGTTTAYLLNGSDATKKGSTSTIWTSEESILRSVGAVDEDNNSTSSSACEEASGALSSGKSGISLDSSGLDNDNNESGIGTATPPKDMSYWKSVHHHHHHHNSHHHHNNDSESVSSLDALRKMKFQKSSSVASSDDPDLLEVLSLCDDEPHGDSTRGEEGDEAADRPKAQPTADADDEDDNEAADEDDEGHDEFETAPYCDCEFTDGDASSASGSGSAASANSGSSGGGGGGTRRPAASATTAASSGSDGNGVVLRRKYNATPIMVPFGGRAQKCRSHSLDASSSLPSSPYQLHTPVYPHHAHAPFGRKLHHHHHAPHQHHLHGARVTKDRVQLSLALRQEPFQSLLAPTHFHELPSPSSASLHSGHESIGIQELTTKSSSAPLLLKQEKRRDDFARQNLTLRYSRSQSDRYLAEIEAVEACKWLRAAGFPQYAQMYEDHQFPIDLSNVAKDHTNLENDQLQSLYRRLCILNRCANMRLDQSHKAPTPQQKEESDDENFALSENWTFQPHIRRWSRIGEMGLELPPAGKLNALEKTESSSKESSPDRFEDDAYDASGAGLSLTVPGANADDSTDTTLNESANAGGVRLRRTGSERLKDGAKAFLRHVESIKSRRRKRQNREGIVISGPQALDLSQLGQRGSLRKPDAVYSTPPSPSAVSPMHTFPKSQFFGNDLKVPSQSENFLSPNRSSPKRTPTTPRSMRTSPLHFFTSPMPHLKEGKSDDSSSYYSDSQESSTGGKLSLRKMPLKTRRFLQRTGKVDDIGAHSDSECHHGRKLLIKDANSNTTEVKLKKLTRGGSLNLGKDPKKRDGFRSSSFRSRSTVRKDIKSDETANLKKTPVVRWHSFQMEERPHMIFSKCFSQKTDPSTNDPGIPFAAMSAGQLQIIRKLALVVLTGHMERYCPTHRSGWNWELPKFIKKIKMPDYKDKKVFGVPLLLILQRSGQTLPIAVRAAFRWLQLNALDQVGLFRKSGVKSRIIKLKELIEFSETTAECMEVFDAQQAYDVADMLKQYFRDLPESLLTTKMSETFAAIFQHLPPDVRLDAVQSAVLLLPDENREILFALLEFLTLVAANSQYNQMTANNLAVCLAPSLFHSSISTGTASVSASPRRRGKGTGVPDVKELSEAKASHECLSFMIDNYRHIYTASKEKISKCNFGYMEESKPVALEALGEGMQFTNWRGYLYECTSATIKEGREKTRGWFTITSQVDNSVDMAYKKVGDGHPLRLWRCITEVEGPPKDVLDYIIKQRASWDAHLLQSQTVKKVDDRTEIFHFALDGQVTTDFCVLRSWQTDLPRGACVIVETSIDHGKAKPMYGAVRGVVLASRYLIEPCGSGRSRVMHLSRVDMKGKTPEWYNKSYGHICAHYLSRIRLAFKNVADGPESKV